MSYSRVTQTCWLFLYVGILFLLSGCSSGDSNHSDIAEPIDYNRHVRPILSDKCFSCHGPDKNKREANLRLDEASFAYSELDESPGKFAIIPGKPNRSEVVRRISHDNPEEIMPPAESKLALTDREKAVLIKWINQGATYEPLWSLIPPENLPPPDLKSDWIQNEIDAFVLQNLVDVGLTPAKPATKETLIRRAAFDLTGLPPTLDEIDTFLADASTTAFETVIDRYLASPVYGERMASWWLDIARYADSDGYLDDKHRDFSPWRDWVIRAFNQNLPYNTFVTWQLAGDLLPNASQEQVLATAFNRLHKKNSEAGIVFEEFRAEYVADRTNTFGKAFLGLTLECARCHDHKYDPISQKEYYELFSFFNSTDEIGHAVYGPDQTPGPALLLATKDEQIAIDSLKKAIQMLEDKRTEIQSNDASGFTIWLSTPSKSGDLLRGMRSSLTAHYTFDRIKSKSGKATAPNLVSATSPASLNDPELAPGYSGKAIVINDYNSIQLGEKIGWFDRTDPFTISLWIYPDTLYKEAMLFTHSEEWRLGLRGYTLQLENNYPVFRMAHSYPQNAIKIVSEEQVTTRDWTQITITYDGSSRAAGLKIFQNGSPARVSVARDNLYKGILFTPDIHTYGFNGIEMGQRGKFTPFKRGRIDEFKVFNRRLSALEAALLFDPNTPINTDRNQADLRDHFFAQHHQPSDRINNQLKSARDSLNNLFNGIREIMVMGDLPEPRPTHVLNRGLYNAPADEVQPATPAAIFSFPQDLPSNRLGLARWLFHPENPLTSRVIVNRIWQQHFGNGLVSTLDDFGNQGASPTNDLLLDWLASTFQNSGWDLKALHKTIMLSATYRQSSVITQELLAMDPENNLHARGPAFRLPAEMIRDNALAISGLLSTKTGGPSVYPYQPAGLWDELTTKSWRYPYLQEPGEGLYRRSLYTIWKRTSPPPSMLLFDAPDRSSCTVERTMTSTPLQALALLNDPQYVEASRALVERLLVSETEPADILQTMHRLIMGRRATSDELMLLQEFYDVEVQTFTADPAGALAYLAVGEHPRNKQLPPAQTAALSVVANALLNTDEGYMRR